VAPITNTYQRFQSIGEREELANVIYNIAPTETPFMSNAGRGSSDQTFYEWQTDTLQTAVSTNHQVEGDDITAFDAVNATSRVGTYTQISRKTLIVSDTNEVTNKAGRKSEISYNLAKKGKELKRDMEFDLLSNHGAAAGSASTARVTGALMAWIKTNVNKAGDGVSPVYTNIPTDVRTDGTQRAFTETLLKDILQQCWTAGASISTVLLGGLGKQVASGFAGVVELNSPQAKAGQATIVGAANVYISDFGDVRFVPERFQRSRDAFVLDFEYLSVDYLRPFKTVPLAKTGDAEKRMLVCEYGLTVRNEAALGIIADLTP
jgi:hypothetical protein